MSVLIATERARIGTVLVGVGALLLAVSLGMFWLAPAAVAGHEQPHRNPHSFPSLADCAGVEEYRAGGWKLDWPSKVEAHGVDPDDLTWEITQEPEHEVVNPEQGNVSDPPEYFDYHYMGAEFELMVVTLKYGQERDSYTPVPNPGSVLLPANISYITLCFAVAEPEEEATTTTTEADTTTTTEVAGPEEPTTTTTEADTTTTTEVAGPEEPTTTTEAVEEAETTVVAGPEEPTTTTEVLGPDADVLPETGPEHALALVAGGLGLVLMGSGSLVIASDRRRPTAL